MHSTWLKHVLNFPLLWNQPRCLMGWRATQAVSLGINWRWAMKARYWPSTLLFDVWAQLGIRSPHWWLWRSFCGDESQSPVCFIHWGVAIAHVYSHTLEEQGRHSGTFLLLSMLFNYQQLPWHIFAPCHHQHDAQTQFRQQHWPGTIPWGQDGKEKCMHTATSHALPLPTLAKNGPWLILCTSMDVVTETDLVVLPLFKWNLYFMAILRTI